MIEAKTKEIEAKTKEMEAKSKEIEAKCLSKAEIKELITDECSKNPCQNAKKTSNRRVMINGPFRRRPTQNRREDRRKKTSRSAQNGQSIAYD